MFGSSKKKHPTKDINWKRLEKEGESSDFFRGFNIETQKVLETGKRPDFVGVSRHDGEKIVGDAKCVKELSKDNVDQVKGYKETLHVKRGFIVTSENTKVPHEVRRYAWDSNIRIKRMDVKRKKNIFQRFFE
jgi:hypothetical protein